MSDHGSQKNPGTKAITSSNAAEVLLQKPHAFDDTGNAGTLLPNEPSDNLPSVPAPFHPYDDDEKQEIEVLSHLENARLISQYAEAVHSQDAELINKIKWKIVLANIPLIYTIAWPIFKKLRCAEKGFDIEDLVSLGYDGVLRAIVTFDPSRNFTFATYAGWWIKSFIVRYVHDHDRTMRIPQYIYEKIPRIRMAEDYFLMHGRADCSDSEIAERLGWDEREVSEIRSIIRQSFTSLDTPRGNEHDAVMYNYCPNSSPDPEHVLMSESGHNVIRSLLDLSPKIKGSLKHGERCILKLRFGIRSDHEKVLVKAQDSEGRKIFREISIDYDGREKTLEEIGVLFGVTRERIRQIELSALRKLRKLYYNQIIKEADLTTISIDELSLIQRLHKHNPSEAPFRSRVRHSKKLVKIHDSENLKVLKRFIMDKDILVE